jgi:hypothetical protein
LAKRLHRRRFLEIDQPEKRIGYGGHVCIDSFYSLSEIVEVDLITDFFFACVLFIYIEVHVY